MSARNGSYEWIGMAAWVLRVQPLQAQGAAVEEGERE